MLLLLLTCSWLVLLAAVVAVCRAGAAADAASAGQSQAAARPLRIKGIPGLTVWDHGDRARLQRSGFAAKRPHARRLRGAHRRHQRRPAVCT